MQTSLPVAEHIARLSPYVPGKPIDELQRELGITDVIKLASNENPLGPSPKALAAIESAARSIYLYPDGGAPALRSAVAALTDMPPDCLVFGNGSDEILHLLALTFLHNSAHIVQADPSFAMYEIYGKLCNAAITKVPLKDYTHDLDAIADAITSETRIVFVANPNNPTGTLVTQPEVDRFMARVPENVITVFDEAYAEYVTNPDKPDMRPYIRDGRNVVILRTFSKAFGLAGLRVGYGIARPEIIGLLNRVRSPFNVNLLAQAAAAAAAGDTDHLERTIAANTAGRVYLEQAFEKMGLEYVPSEANFILVDVKKDAKEVASALERRGVIIRAGLGLATHIRVTIGTQPQNERFIASLADVLA
jgi:histidinol-phosphate aminotransferase